jgi:hypothetical protein
MVIRTSATVCFEREIAAELYEIGDLEYREYEFGVLDTMWKKLWSDEGEKRKNKVQENRRDRYKTALLNNRLIVMPYVDNTQLSAGIVGRCCIVCSIGLFMRTIVFAWKGIRK